MLKHPIFRFFASLRLAVFVILLLAVVLGTATVLESLFGMRGAHVLVYGTWWFGGVLILLSVNVLCAALSRIPWKRRQTGFVITHAGILILIFGSFLTKRFGVDGNMPVVEGTQDSEVILNELRVGVTPEDGEARTEYTLRETAREVRGEVMEIAFTGGKKLRIDGFIPRAVAERQVVPSRVPGVGLPALRVELYNDRFQLDEWLFSQHPNRPTEVNLGPAILGFRKLWTEDEVKAFLAAPDKLKEPESSKGFIVAKYQGKDYRLPVDALTKSWTRVGSTALEVKVERYLPHAVVENNELISKSNDPVNPAVQLMVRDSAKTVEKHSVFALFPEFSTRHGSKEKPGRSLGVEFKMVVEAQAERESLGMVGKNRGQLHFAQGPGDGKLYYLARSAAGEIRGKGEVKEGQVVSTGWMDLKFKVARWIPSASASEQPRSVDYISGGDSNFLSAIHVVPDGSETGHWIMEGTNRLMAIDGKNYEIALGKSRLLLPFQIFLEKFTVGTDPGTTKAATYESQVKVKDAANGVDSGAQISMNEPLHHGGYTFYQASYVMQEGRPPISVFSVNYDPGRWVKYIGALLMVLGTLVMFYMNPQYLDKLLSRKKEGIAS